DADVPCLALAGLVRVPPDQLAAGGFLAAHALTELEPDPARCRAEAAPLLAALAERVIIPALSGDAAR
ncbi:MAG TPA: hypothetical protein VD834_03320, partial [Blastococcus sp.]|nr:hypothetical protein [Blastococcus sp.]